MILQNISVLLFSSLICFTTHIFVTASNCTYDGLYIIKNPKSGLVVDGYALQAEIQNYSDSSTQFWSFECGNRPGYFYIVNYSSRLVLGLNNLSNDTTPNRNPVFLVPRDDRSLIQQWILTSDGVIVNVGVHIYLDIVEALIYEPGTKIQVYQRHYSDAQQFAVEKKI